MSLIEVPAPESSGKKLEATEREIERLKSSISDRTSSIEETAAMTAENARLEAEIQEAKLTMLSLLHERMELGKITNAEEYIKLLMTQLETLSGPAEVKKK
jgi:hypothetical protein